MKPMLAYQRTEPEKPGLFWHVIACSLSASGALCALASLAVVIITSGEREAGWLLVFWAAPLWVLSLALGVAALVARSKCEASRATLVLNNLLWLANLACVIVLVWMM